MSVSRDSTPPGSPLQGVTLDDLQVSPSMGMDDVELISSDDEDGSNFMKNLCEEAEYAHKQLKSEYEGIGIPSNGDTMARRGSLEWTDKLLSARSMRLGTSAAGSTSSKYTGEPTAFPSDISTDPYSSGGNEDEDAHQILDEDLFEDEHNQGYAKFLENKELETTLSPEEKKTRQALQQHKSESQFLAEFQQRSQYRLYDNFRGTPAGDDSFEKGSSASQSSLKNASPNLDRIEKISEMSKRKQEEKKAKGASGGGLWCCGGR